MAAHCSGCVFTVCVCVCVFTAVCVHVGWVKCRAPIPSMGHHTWPYVTSLSLYSDGLFFLTEPLWVTNNVYKTLLWGLLPSLFPGARKSVRSAHTDPSVPFTVTVRMGPSVTTSTERVCVIQDSKGLTARKGSVHQASTVSSVTNTAPVHHQHTQVRHATTRQ